MLDRIQPESLLRTVESLSAFHTRNTLSPTLDDALAWLADQYRELPGCEVELMEYMLPEGRRVPFSRPVRQVVARLPGRSGRTVLLGAHVDSLNLEVEPESGRAPGANDDASGVAACLEVARVLSAAPREHSLFFVAFSGEEQGLHGARAMAARATAERWELDAVLNNDTVGSSSNLRGQVDREHVRVFSDPGPGHTSRELARLAEWTGRDVPGFGVKLVLRKDRFGRAGDHTPFAEAGYSAIRLIEVHEEYARQHTPHDLVEAMDFEYLAQVTRLNLLLAHRLSWAGAPPQAVEARRENGHDTRVVWESSPGVEYDVFWRDTRSAAWDGCVLAGQASEVFIEGVNVDDHHFAVGARGGVPVAAPG